MFSPLTLVCFQKNNDYEFTLRIVPKFDKDSESGVKKNIFFFTNLTLEIRNTKLSLFRLLRASLRDDPPRYHVGTNIIYSLFIALLKKRDN